VTISKSRTKFEQPQPTDSADLAAAAREIAGAIDRFTRELRRQHLDHIELTHGTVMAARFGKQT